MILFFGKEGVFHVVGKDIQNIAQNLFKQRMKWRREIKKYVAINYTADKPKATNTNKTVVCMIDGKMKHGGLGDRIRGIISVYSVCKSLSLDFKIYFDSPFNILDFFIPNQCDWKISKEELCYNSEDALPLFCGSNGTHVEPPFQRRWFVKNFNLDVKQIHVYTNAHLLRNRNFKKAFDELFKPTHILEESIKNFENEIGGRYISITCRFQQLLGDFEEGDYDVLTKEEQKALIDAAVKNVDKIHNSYKENLPVAVTSDSIKFLNYITSKLPYVHTVKGKLVHMDYTEAHATATHLKSFTDMMVISKAEKVFLLKSEKMYNSGFPRIAALIGGKPFKLVRF